MNFNVIIIRNRLIRVRPLEVFIRQQPVLWRADHRRPCRRAAGHARRNELGRMRVESGLAEIGSRAAIFERLAWK